MSWHFFSSILGLFVVQLWGKFRVFLPVLVPWLRISIYKCFQNQLIDKWVNFNKFLWAFNCLLWNISFSFFENEAFRWLVVNSYWLLVTLTWSYLFLFLMKMKYSEKFWKINSLDTEPKYHRSDKICKVLTKSLTVYFFTKNFSSFVSSLLPFYKHYGQSSIWC